MFHSYYMYLFCPLLLLALLATEKSLWFLTDVAAVDFVGWDSNEDEEVEEEPDPDRLDSIELYNSWKKNSLKNIFVKSNTVNNQGWARKPTKSYGTRAKVILSEKFTSLLNKSFLNALECRSWPPRCHLVSKFCTGAPTPTVDRVTDFRWKASPDPRHGLATNSNYFCLFFFWKKSVICREGKSMTPPGGKTCFSSVPPRTSSRTS